MIGALACDKVRYWNNRIIEQVYVYGTYAAAWAHVLYVCANSGFCMYATHFDRLNCAANGLCIIAIYQSWSSCSDLTNTVPSRSHARRDGSAMYIAAMQKCCTGTETTNHGKKSQEV